jgi:cell division septation protein DedD
MLRNSDGESEILLGNKQLLGIFFVIALLLGVAFAGGYVVGHGPSRKVDSVPSDTASSTAQTGSGSAGETHALPADPSASGSAATTSRAKEASVGSGSTGAKTSPAPERAESRQTYQPPSGEDAAPPLGSKHPLASKPKTAAGAEDTGTDRAASLLDYTPQSGQTFLQVAAVSRDEAAAIADVLHKKGFRAHAVPKPGSSKIYRILIGPIHSAADLSSTRESLRNKMGFREVIVQRY